MTARQSQNATTRFMNMYAEVKLEELAGSHAAACSGDYRKAFAEVAETEEGRYWKALSSYKKKARGKRIMRAFTLKEISACPNPAQQYARATIIK